MKGNIVVFRKILAVPAALAAVVAVAAGANAATDVGSNTSGSYAVTAVNKGAITVTLGSLSLGCTSANATGVAKAGGAGHTNYLEFSDLGLVGCVGPGGIAADVDVVSCTTGGIDINYTGAVTTGLDTSVAGTLGAGTSSSPCIEVTTLGGICQLDLYGSTSATFNETVKANGSQDLTISGTGLTVANIAGFCPGVSNGNTVGLSIPFNVFSPSGAINLKPTP